MEPQTSSFVRTKINRCVPDGPGEMKGTSGRKLPRSSHGAAGFGRKSAGSWTKVVGKVANQDGSQLVVLCSLAFGPYGVAVSR